MKNTFKKIHGFTIIELLVVISIISILMTLSLIGSEAVMRKSRDANRKTDLGKVKTTLMLYFTDKKYYPLPCKTIDPDLCLYAGETGGYSKMIQGLVDLKYTDGIPQDVKEKPNEGFAYRYRPSEDGLNFELSAKMENDNDGELTKDNIDSPGKDDFRYEVGTDKSIRTVDTTDGTYPNPSAGNGLSINGDWNYTFQAGKNCTGCLMQ